MSQDFLFDSESVPAAEWTVQDGALYCKKLCEGYHVYKDIWEASIGEELICVRETSNAKDPFAVAVVKNEVIVGHIPKKISSLCSLFLK